MGAGFRGAAGPASCRPSAAGSLTVRRNAQDLRRESAWSDRVTQTLVERISQRGAGRGYKGGLGAVVVIWMEGDGDQQWSGSRYVLKVELRGVSDKLWGTEKDRGFSMHLKDFSQSKWKEAMR